MHSWLSPPDLLRVAGIQIGSARFNRVAGRLLEGEKTLNPAGYYFGVARLILLR